MQTCTQFQNICSNYAAIDVPAESAHKRVTPGGVAEIGQGAQIVRGRDGGDAGAREEVGAATHAEDAGPIVGAQGDDRRLLGCIQGWGCGG